MILDVWCGDEKVGQYNLKKDFKEAPSEFPIVEYGIDKDHADIHHFHWIQVNPRMCKLDDRLLRDFGETQEILAHNNVPADASISKDLSQMKTVYTWYVADPNIDQYEIMFDLPEFTPC